MTVLFHVSKLTHRSGIRPPVCFQAVAVSAPREEKEEEVAPVDLSEIEVEKIRLKWLLNDYIAYRLTALEEKVGDFLSFYLYF